MEMSKLEKIVASLELCKLIPAGEFNDTALVWKYDRICGFICLVPGHPDETARLRNDGMIYPAPTAEEIMEKLDEPLLWCRDDGIWRCSCNSLVLLENGKNASAAALRLWLRVKGIEIK